MSWSDFVGGPIQFQNEYDSRGARGAGTVRVWSRDGRRHTDMQVATCIAGTEIGAAFWCGNYV